MCTEKGSLIFHKNPGRGVSEAAAFPPPQRRARSSSWRGNEKKDQAVDAFNEEKDEVAAAIKDKWDNSTTKELYNKGRAVPALWVYNWSTCIPQYKVTERVFLVY